MIRYENQILPIEIKSKKGKDKSLYAVIKDGKEDLIHHGLKFGEYNIGNHSGVIALPYFTLFLLSRVIQDKQNTFNQLLEN